MCRQRLELAPQRLVAVVGVIVHAIVFLCIIIGAETGGGCQFGMTPSIGILGNSKACSFGVGVVRDFAHETDTQSLLF